MPSSTSTGPNRDKIDIRRLNGQVSCAECRRLKLKCDKRVPCSSCTRRGCHSICPTGTLVNGMGKKLVVSDTADLHQTIEQFGNRIKELEDSLQQFQTEASSEPHPLLRPELLSIKFPPGLVIPQDVHTRPPSPAADLADMLGTMAINDQGYTRYFGSSAGTESLFLAGAEMRTMIPGEADVLPNLTLQRPPVKDFPLLPNCQYDIPGCLERTYTILPSRDQAWHLMRSFENASVSGQIVTQEEFVEEMLIPLYDYLDQRQYTADNLPHPLSCHQISVVLAVFTLGILVDFSIPPYAPEADIYMSFSVAILTVDSPITHTDFTAVQALLLLAVALNQGGRKYTVNGAWSLASMASKLGQSLGLHYELGVSNIEPKILDRRRRLFWELYSFELTLCFKLGRPPSIAANQIHCEFPIDDDQRLDKDGDILPGYHRCKWTFVRDILAKIVGVMLHAEPPTYKTILEIDRELRRHHFYKKYPYEPVPEDASLKQVMRMFLLRQARATTGINVHLSYFAQATMNNAEDPLRSPYAASYLAAYRSASWYIYMAVAVFEKFPQRFIRWWSTWSSVFTTGVILGTVAVRSADLVLASRAFAEFGLAVDLFEKGALHNTRARQGLIILYRLRDKAAAKFSTKRGDQGVDASGQQFADFDDEMEIFAGKTRTMVSTLLRRKWPPKPKADTNKVLAENIPLRDESFLPSMFDPSVIPVQAFQGSAETLQMPPLPDYGLDWTTGPTMGMDFDREPESTHFPETSDWMAGVHFANDGSPPSSDDASGQSRVGSGAGADDTFMKFIDDFVFETSNNGQHPSGESTDLSWMYHS
ncbi:hypothetical protein CYLTODRAFT_422770 [Cylindrobasidium torrendii FP15055 ss-10]|uniref:Zn(2)-C6 fungal-type domain-containing protein n=1 Tax=Cylindrobasidium torrendii FP15055 ss-10 TaxID=1314674 RepID=A0A0D7B974_9AGAR|nr:hypothetical protein CYLTODRAFT_422770 [Cylindrobasidium torrendii FP15055 ss-10]